MDSIEAQHYIKGARTYRTNLAKPLYASTTSPEERKSVIGDLKVLHDLNHEDPDYRQSLRIVTELRGQREFAQRQALESSRSEQRTEFPTDPEERFKAIISSMGNHAGKQITFLSIGSVPNAVVTPGELHTSFIDKSGGAWNTSKLLQTKHTRHSLIPIGMVAEEAVIRSGSTETTVGFSQTEAGIKYGDPIARFLLKYAAEHDISLEKNLGSTLSTYPDTRAPYTRAKLLEYLALRKDEPNTRIIDITTHLGSSATHSLEELQEVGLLVFESVNLDKNARDKFPYKKNPDYEGAPVSVYNSILKPVLSAIQALEASGADSFRRNAILTEIQKSDPDYKKKNVYAVLSSLARSGYLIRSEFKGGDTQSTVTILQEGVDFVNDVLIPLHIALTDTPEGQILRGEWHEIQWQEYAPKALSIHKENSHKANPTDHVTLLGVIHEIIMDNPGIRSFEISNELKSRDFTHTNNLTNLLRNSGDTIRNVHEKHISRWYPATNLNGIIDEKV